MKCILFQLWKLLLGKNQKGVNIELFFMSKKIVQAVIITQSIIDGKILSLVNGIGLEETKVLSRLYSMSTIISISENSVKKFQLFSHLPMGRE